ncbi:inositol 1,4,5-trisphosphate receptor-interacting protein-like 2 [Erpetoichthys calabaricus]|uniref:ITPRIP like 2 n=1 Tax=Erpetoichthys calabaricus TaxID=27687 RepID=A0A8C4T5J8_ERPCA|nr:inositol 1,4,5-trisphosphate receptor-interacting protein-like 2 [Erpetoichthys calabaricus]XP_051789905.1 inositol 1,4,5-trisphosphate receptor-interacting protein-like 2 [Erpetoichthys calabaricus]
MTVYTLNLRVFWPLVFCILLATLCFHQILHRGHDSGPDGCDTRSHALLSLVKLILAFGFGYLLIKRCSSSPRTGRREERKLQESLAGPPAAHPNAARKELLDTYYEKQVRLSPHVLGHSKAHVAKLVSELVRAGRADIPPESSLAFRGDYIQIGSAYEEHKVGSPDCFDLLVPLRLPRGLKLEPRCHLTGDCGPGGLAGCSLEAPRKSDWVRHHRAFVDGFFGELGGSEFYRLRPPQVLRWFYSNVQRCLSAIRYPFEQRCYITLSLAEDRVLLHLNPRSDYVCCHISMGVRLIPALHLGDGAYLVAQPKSGVPGSLHEMLWNVYFPKHEQKFLGWVKGRMPASSCHLKCLQLLKAMRELSGQMMDVKGATQWRTVLSSYAIKMAWMQLLLCTPPEAWEECHLVERVEDLLRTLRDGLHKRQIGHIFMRGDAGPLPDFHCLPKFLKEVPPTNLIAGFDPADLDLVSARLAYSWVHLHRLIRLGRPQRDSAARAMRCKHLDST